MNLPHAEHAIIESAKLRDYLLSASHPIGRFKAPFFRALGYTQEGWEELETGLREQHLLARVRETVQTDYGVKYVIHASLKGPNGKSAEVVSVWIVLDGERFPRFVTAYPGET